MTVDGWKAERPGGGRWDISWNNNKYTYVVAQTGAVFVVFLIKFRFYILSVVIKGIMLTFCIKCDLYSKAMWYQL